MRSPPPGARRLSNVSSLSSRKRDIAASARSKVAVDGSPTPRSTAAPTSAGRRNGQPERGGHGPALAADEPDGLRPPRAVGPGREVSRRRHSWWPGPAAAGRRRPTARRDGSARDAADARPTACFTPPGRAAALRSRRTRRWRADRSAPGGRRPRAQPPRTPRRRSRRRLAPGRAGCRAGRGRTVIASIAAIVGARSALMRPPRPTTGGRRLRPTAARRRRSRGRGSRRRGPGWTGRTGAAQSSSCSSSWSSLGAAAGAAAGAAGGPPAASGGHDRRPGRGRSRERRFELGELLLRRREAGPQLLGGRRVRARPGPSPSRAPPTRSDDAAPRRPELLLEGGGARLLLLERRLDRGRGSPGGR